MSGTGARPSSAAIERGALGPSVALVTVSGELDLFLAPELRDAIAAALNEDVTSIVLDLSATRFIDSSGLGVLLDALRRVRARQGRLVVADSAGSVRRVFEIAGIEQILEIAPSRAAAVKTIGEGGSETNP